MTRANMAAAKLATALMKPSSEGIEPDRVADAPSRRCRAGSGTRGTRPDPGDGPALPPGGDFSLSP